MNLGERKLDLSKKLTDLQGQKANLEVALDQTRIAIERLVGQLQLLDQLTHEEAPANG